jgi:hypothetical protein
MEAEGGMSSPGVRNQRATATASKITLDGQEVFFAAYNIAGNNYCKLRAIGQALDFAVLWDGENNTIVIDTSTGYTK